MKKSLYTLTIILSFLWLPSNAVFATTITSAPPCTFETNSKSNESTQYPTLMKCNVWQDDGRTQKVVTYKLTQPAFTPLQNCIVTQAKSNTLSTQMLYAPTVNGKCQAYESGLYVSMVYVSENRDKDKVFSQILRLKATLEKKGEHARTSLAIPFYELWFCKQCNDFLGSIDKGSDIIIRSLNMNYSDFNAAELAIKVNDERWLLSLSRKNDKFSIIAVYRTQ